MTNEKQIKKQKEQKGAANFGTRSFLSNKDRLEISSESFKKTPNSLVAKHLKLVKTNQNFGLKSKQFNAQISEDKIKNIISTNNQTNLKNQIRLNNSAFNPFVWLSIIFVVVLILSNISASNTVNIGGLLSFSAAEILFPISYVISDLFVELYGFKRTKKLIFLGLIITLCSMGFLYLTTLLPTGYTEYQTVFGFFSGGVIGITIASILAYVVGSLVNATIMDKLKRKDGEKRFFVRAMLSTFAAEILDSLAFITFCCIFASQFYAWDRLLQFVLTISAIKIAVEILIFPLTRYLLKIIKSKQINNISHNNKL